MEIQAGTIFNLWDTNGRRKDVLNALDIYVHILHDLSNQYPAEKWGAYPQSLAQFRFYKAAIELLQMSFWEQISTKNLYNLLHIRNLIFTINHYHLQQNNVLIWIKI